MRDSARGSGFADPNMTAGIAARWQLALADAGLADGRDAIIHVFDRPPDSEIASRMVTDAKT
jgi:hypothetical protein